MTFKEDSKSLVDGMLENLAYWNDHTDEFDERENRRLSNFKPYTEVFPTPKLNKDGTVKRDADVTNASERKSFHLAGKHDQKAHGRGGSSKAKGGFPAAGREDDLSMEINANGGGFPQSMLDDPNVEYNDMALARDSYRANQVAALDHLQRDNQLRDSETMVKHDESFIEGGAIKGNHLSVQKSANAGRIAERMDAELADVSTEELRAVRDDLKDKYGLIDNDYASQEASGKHPLTDEDIPPGKRWILKPNEDFTRNDPVLVDEREAYMHDISSGMVGTWARTSNAGYPPSTAVQDSIKEQYLDPRVDEWGHPSKAYLGKTESMWSAEQKRTEDAQKFRDMQGGLGKRVTDAYVKATYEETQAALSADNIESLVLHRGTGRGDDVVHNSRGRWRMNPATSWTRSKKVSSKFGNKGGHVEFTSVIPKERIWSTAATGAGCWKEEEFIVIGGIVNAHALKE